MKLILVRPSAQLRAVFLALFFGIFFGREIFYPELFLIFGILIFVFSLSLKNFLLGLLSLFCLGNFYGQMRNSLDLRADQLPHYYEKRVILTGVVFGFPDKREKNNRIFVKILNIENEKKRDEASQDLGKLLLVYGKQWDLNYGDKISFSGKILRPEKFNDFDYLRYLQQFEVQSIIRNPKKITILEKKSGGNFLVRKAKFWRDFFEKNLEYYLPDPHQKIAMGILLGIKNELPREMRESFKNSGLQHLLVVSGFNITIIMAVVGFLLRNFGSRVQFLGSGMAILFFVGMVGADPPVLRASIFGIVLGWAVMRGRLSDGRNLILFTAVILALYSPLMIQVNAGFWLSFFATMGIILGLPIVEKSFLWLPKRLNFRSLFGVIFSAQMAVFPILTLYFLSFPFGGFLANFLAEPLVPLGMLFSFLLTLGSFLPEFLVQIFAFLDYQILNGLISLAEIFGQFGVIEIPKVWSYFSLYLVCLFFLWANFSEFYQRKFLE